MSLDDWGTESLGGESTAAIDEETVTDSFTDDWTDDDLNFDALVGLGDELVSAEETDLPSTPAADGLSLDSFDFDLDGDGENMPNATPESSAATDASNLEVDFGTAFGDPALGDTDFNLDDLLGSEGTDQASGTDLDADGGANLDADLDLGAFNPGDLDMDLSLDGLDGLGGLDLMSGSDAPESVTDGSSLDNLDDLDSFLSTPADPADLASGGGDIDDLALDLDLGGELGDLDDLLNDAGGDGSSNGNGGPSGLSEAYGLSDLEAFLETPAAQGASMGPGALLDEDLDDGLAEMTRLLQQAEAGVGPLPAVPTVPKRSKTTQKGLQKRQVDQSMRVPVKQLDNLNNLVGEMVVNRNSLETDRDRLRDSLEKLLSQVQQLSDVGQRLQDLYERSLLENALLSSRQSLHAHKPAANLNLSKNGAKNGDGAEEDDDFDALEMDRFSGFHLLSQEMIELIVRVRESSSDIEYIVNEPLDYVARNFRQITAQLQEELTRSRMLPFEYTATRIPRAVRTVSQKCGKKAEVVTEGIDVLIDKVLLDQIYDPMTHLVNNAVTHGIESPEERLKVGKPEIGTIRVQAFHQGNQTVISISDDGAGIDTDRVRAKALSKGLITPEEAKTLSDMELYEFLFHPGFSTKDQADDFSGRGVGMDVVRTKISELRGNVTIDSDLGHGTTFTVRLPLTLSISKALCCISSRARVAFPMDGVEDMLDVPRDRVQNNDQGQPSIYWRDQPMPFRPLSELLRYNRASRSTVYGGSQDEDMLSVVILRSASEYMALQVDRVDGEKEIVIKQLEGPVPKPTGIAGVTVLADGTVMPIADVLELIDIAKGRTRQSTTALWQEDGPTDVIPEADVPHEPMVLIVDDSIVVRELLSMSFRKFNYRVEQARDGQEAWEKLRSGLPCDIIFCDIEMPRMTGLELLEKLQGDDHLNQIPMAMLTSRGATKHREMALKLGARGYFTKPYLEEALLEAASRMLKGEVLLNASTAA
ncbi:MAG: response regulator [Prochlorothrix sp.]